MGVAKMTVPNAEKCSPFQYEVAPLMLMAGLGWEQFQMTNMVQCAIFGAAKNTVSMESF